MKIRSSIGTRLAAATVALVAAIVGVIVWQWASSQRALVRSEKVEDAYAYGRTIANVFMNELDDENWSQVRVDTELALIENPDLQYLVIHDSARRDHRIVAAVPADLVGGYVPDIVPLAVTRAALAATAPITQETVVLHDIRLGDKLHAAAGEPVAETTVPITNSSGKLVGTLRLAVSLAAVDRAVRDAAFTALAIGGGALLLGVIAALLVARRLARRIGRLAADAQRIAGGELGHRAAADRPDELGALGDAFNDMSTALEASFGTLQRTASTFERFVPRKFLAVVAREGIENIQVGTSTTRRVAVLFSDIRGYTQVCEGMEPEQIFAMLNDYIGRMGRAIDRAGGFVDKYIGDAVMALFDDAHTDAVMDAILGMRAELATLNAERAAKGLPPLQHGIGAHVGEVVMGTIGFAAKIESTVIGDAVNVASRVEGLTKQMGIAVLVTADIVDGLRDRGSYWLRKLPEPAVVRGRREPVELYELVENEGIRSAESAGFPVAR